MSNDIGGDCGVRLRGEDRGDDSAFRAPVATLTSKYIRYTSMCTINDPR